MVEINVYSGDQLSEAIDEAISNYNWTEATGTSDKSEQWRIIYQGLLIKFPNIKNPGIIFKDIHPDPVQIHLFNGSSFPAVNFDIKKSVAVIKPTFTYNYTSEFGTFTIAAESELIAYAAFQQWLKEKEAGEPVIPPIIPPVIPPIIPPVIPPITPPVTPPVVTPPVTPPIDDSINTNMVTQQMINFNIVNGRAVGSIKFVATNNFNPYYYGKNILNIVMFKDPNGANILTTVKTNNLNFTETERDEVINYSEDMQGNTRATVESFVWEWIDKPAGAFSNMFSIEISEAEPPKPLTSGFMGAGAVGAIAGLVLLGFIIDHKVSKR